MVGSLDSSPLLSETCATTNESDSSRSALGKKWFKIVLLDSFITHVTWESDRTIFKS